MLKATAARCHLLRDLLPLSWMQSNAEGALTPSPVSELNYSPSVKWQGAQSYGM